MSDRFLHSFSANEVEARAGIRTVVAHLVSVGLSADQAGSVEIALAEVINNIVEHACATASDTEILVRCRMHAEGLGIRICDTGRAMPGNRLPAGLPADVSGPRQALPEGGFGWFLIRKLTSNIRYARSGGCNHLSLKFDLSDSGD